jgi:putative iron-regulated protein
MIQRRRLLRAGFATVVAATALAGVGAPGAGAVTTSLDGVTADEARSAAEGYAEVVRSSYDSSIASAKHLQAAVQAFVASPTQETLDAAKQAWLTARDDYGPTEAFRLYGGPIDHPKTGLEGQINAWPLDEAYIDSVEDDPDAGIVNDTEDYPEITRDVLVEANEQGGETNISTGWHAIEFLLWGQDTTAGQPGQRPVTDYTTAPNADRRAAFLTEATDLLVDDLTEVRAQWDDGTKHVKEWLRNGATSVAKSLRGIGALSAGEVAGERMAVAYETKDQEDEHSCFSDNTNADIVGDQIGIRRVYLGELPDGTTVETSISSLVEQVNPKVDAAMRAQLDATTEAIDALPAPFEELIVGKDSDPGRVALLAAIEALEAQGKQIAKVGKTFGAKISVEV